MNLEKARARSEVIATITWPRLYSCLADSIGLKVTLRQAVDPYRPGSSGFRRSKGW
ncbi:hypothetical protein ACOSYY_09905 [Nitrospira sp. BLG_2]